MNGIGGDPRALVNLAVNFVQPNKTAAVTTVSLQQQREMRTSHCLSCNFVQYVSAVLQQNCTLTPFCSCQVLASYFK